METLLYLMMKIRLVEEAIAEKYKEQEMRCPTHLYIGQEAIAAGVSLFLAKEDIVFSTHRSHGHYVAKGGNLDALIAELYGKASGCAHGIGGSQHLIDLSVQFWGSAPIVASTIPIAVGAAFSAVYKKEHHCVVCFFGDAATEEGVFFESINFAVLKKLPVLFVCENNLYSTNTPFSDRQPKGRSRAKVVAAMGVEVSLEGDGNDVLDVWEKARTAIAHIRGRRGPAFVEYTTYRTMEHCGPFPDPAGYRPDEEKKLWAKKDPISTFERYLLKRNIIHQENIDMLKQSITKTIEIAFAKAKASPYTQYSTIRKLVYAR